MAERVREVVERRSLTAKHWLRDDGCIEAEFHQRPLHYQDADGRWQDIDLTPEDDISIPGFDRAFRRTCVPVRFARTSKQPWRLEYGNGWIAYRAQGGRATHAQVAGNVVTYLDAWNGADLRSMVRPDGAKEEIVLKSVVAPASFVFGIELHRLALQADGEGGLELIDDGGLVVGCLPAPRVVDAVGAGGTATMSLDPAAGTLAIAVDPAWLADPARAWPVTVDPTTTFSIGLGADDGYVQRTGNTWPPSTSYNVGTTNTWLEASKYYAGSPYYRVGVGLMRFDTSTLPDTNLTIFSAKLRIVPTYVSNQDARSLIGEYYSASNWPINEPDWILDGGSDAIAAISLSSFAVGVAAELTILDPQNRLSRSGYTGFRLTATGGAPAVDHSNNVQWASLEHATYDEPRLIVIYSQNPTVTLTSPAGTQANPTIYEDQVSGMNLTGTYTDPETQNMAYRQHQILDEEGNAVWDSGQAAGTAISGGTVVVAVPAGYLGYGQLLRWRWRAWDGEGAVSEWSAQGWFRCDCNVPTLTATGETAFARIRVDATLAAERLAGFRVYRGLTAGGLARHNLLLVPPVEVRRNLLTREESNLEAGIGAWISNSYLLITVGRDVAKAWEGLASLKATCSSSVNFIGARSGWHTAEEGRRLVASANVAGTGKVRIAILWSGGWLVSSYPALTLTDEFQLISVAVVVPVGVSQVAIEVVQYGVASPSTFYIDGIQLEYRDAGGPSDWLPGGVPEFAGEFLDDVAACGQAYYYAASAVADDGYESALCAAAQASVTFVGTWLDDLALSVAPAGFDIQEEFTGSIAPALGRPYPVVFRRQAGRRLYLSGMCRGKVEKDTLAAILRAPGPHRYVDPLGEALRVEVAAPVRFSQVRPYDPDQLIYSWSAELVEVF